MNVLLGCPPGCWCSSGPYQLLLRDLSVSEDSSLQSGAVLLSEAELSLEPAPSLGAHVGELATPSPYGKCQTLQ